MLYERLLPKSHESQGNRDKSLFLSIKAVYLCAYSCMLWQKKFLSKLKVPKASETSIDILSKKFMGKTWIWSNICEFENEQWTCDHMAKNVFFAKIWRIYKFSLPLTDRLSVFFILLNPFQRKRLSLLKWSHSFFKLEVIRFRYLNGDNILSYFKKSRISQWVPVKHVP